MKEGASVFASSSVARFVVYPLYCALCVCAVERGGVLWSGGQLMGLLLLLCLCFGVCCCCSCVGVLVCVVCVVVVVVVCVVLCVCCLCVG